MASVRLNNSLGLRLLTVITLLASVVMCSHDIPKPTDGLPKYRKHFTQFYLLGPKSGENPSDFADDKV